MTVRLRLTAVGFALLIPALVVARWTAVLGSPLAPLALPGRVGPWTPTEEHELGPEILAQIEPDAHRLASYEARGRSPIWFYIGLYAGRGGKGGHSPEVCYPAQGWEILSTHSVELSVGNAEVLRAPLLKVHRGPLREAVLYWFQPAERWPADWAAEELLRIADAVAGRPQYAFVRLSTPWDGGPDAVHDLSEFAAEIAPAIRRAVELAPLPSAEAPGSQVQLRSAVIPPNRSGPL